MISKLSMIKLKRFVLIFVIIGLVLACFYYLLILPAIQPKNFHTDYSYRITIEVSEPLHNVTFLIPLPIENKTPMVGTKQLTEEIFREKNYNASFITMEGNLYLKITTDDMASGRENEYRVSYFDYLVAEGVSDLANTRYPIGNETIFLPKYNITTQQPVPASYSTFYGMHYNPVILPYQTQIYADYTTSKEAKMDIFANIDVTNEWVESATHQGNSYRDYYSITLHGPAHGWYLADGKLETGEGKYLDE